MYEWLSKRVNFVELSPTMGGGLQGRGLQYETPNFGPGQYAGVNPGEGSNLVLAGHFATQENAGGRIFGDLSKLVLGDAISVKTKDSLLEYVVSEIRFVSSTAEEIMEPQRPNISR